MGWIYFLGKMKTRWSIFSTEVPNRCWFQVIISLSYDLTESQKKKKKFEVFWANNLKPSLKGNNFEPSTISTQIINKILTVIMQLFFRFVTKTYFFWGSLGSSCSCVLRHIIWHVAKTDKHLVSRLNFNTQLTNAVKTDQNLLLLIIK